MTFIKANIKDKEIPSKGKVLAEELHKHPNNQMIYLDAFKRDVGKLTEYTYVYFCDTCGQVVAVKDEK